MVIQSLNLKTAGQSVDVIQCYLMGILLRNFSALRGGQRSGQV